MESESSVECFGEDSGPQLARFTGILGTIGYVAIPTGGVSTDVSRDIVRRTDKGMMTTTFQVVTETI